MTGWTVLLRGIRYRARRSLVVLLLAALAVTAAVLAPGYARAAQQSVLTDGLRAAPPSATALTVAAVGTADTAPAAHDLTGETRLRVTKALARHPALAGVLDRPVAGVDTDTVLLGHTDPLKTRLAYRDNVCDHLRISGECPYDAGQVLVSDRAAGRYGIRVGDRIALRYPRASSGGSDHRFTVVGTYTPTDPTEPYWGLSGYFAGGGPGAESGATRVDAVFTGAEDDVRKESGATVAMRLEYPLRPAAVRLGNVGPLRAGLAAVQSDLRADDLETSTALPAILDEVSADQAAIGRTAPIIAVPLAVLCWFVLFLLVASFTEERGPEIALAKLRGFPPGRTARFGLGEVLLLLALAAPLGLLLGLGLVEAAARVLLSPGTHVELRWQVVAAAMLALLGAAVAVLLAGRRTLRRPVLGLLRRVPPRGRWRAGVAEGVVVALAAASLVVAVGDRSAPLALLAPPLLAVVAGIAAARLLGGWSRLRLRLARRSGRLPALLSAAQLARRPAGHRVMVVVTVAVALLTFAATAWDAAAQGRRAYADDVVGAHRVYTVAAAHPEALVNAVNRADPGGGSMAVVRSAEQFGDGRVQLIGVEAPLLASVAVWRGYDRETLAGIAAALRPPAPAPLELHGDVGLRVYARSVGVAPVRLAAIVSVPGQPPRSVSLGELARGTRRYTARVAGCAAGCRLIGLSLSRAGAGRGTIAVDIEVLAVTTGGRPVPARLSNPDAWRVVTERAPSARVRLSTGDGLRAAVTSADPGDVVLDYVDGPDALPVVLAGPAPADDPGATDFSFPGFAQSPQPFTVVRTAPVLPRAGGHGLLFDLDYAVRAASRTTGLADSSQLSYEVWAGPRAPADLPARLAANGVQVLRTQSIDGEVRQLSRRAPALGLWLYLLAGAAAVLLAVGAVLLSAYAAAQARLYELAALRVAGVRLHTLRRAVLAEQLALLGLPLLVGAGVGVVAAVLMLPGIPLVMVHTHTTPDLGPPAALRALPAAALVILSGLAAAVALVLRILRRATGQRLREGVR